MHRKPTDKRMEMAATMHFGEVGHTSALRGRRVALFGVRGSGSHMEPLDDKITKLAQPRLSMARIVRRCERHSSGGVASALMTKTAFKAYDSMLIAELAREGLAMSSSAGVTDAVPGVYFCAIWNAAAFGSLQEVSRTEVLLRVT